jgi:DNA gyrase subunit B
VGARLVEQTVNQKLAEFLEENPTDARAGDQKAIARRARGRLPARRASSRAARARSRAPSLPGKLADCQITDPTAAELFLVEGNSAGGSAK